MPLRVLVWCPFLSPGGGHRLLVRLVRGLAGHPDVGTVRVAVGPGAAATIRGSTSDLPAIEVWASTDAAPAVGLGQWVRGGGLLYGVRGTGRVRNRVARTFGVRPPDWRTLWKQPAAAGMDVCYAFWPHSAEPDPPDGLPVVCTMQDTIALEYPENGGAGLVAAEWRRTAGWLARSDRVVVSSEASDRAFKALFGDAWPRPTVIPHRILPDQPSGEGAPPPGLPPRYVVYPANITAHKNHHGLLTAWAGLSPEERVPLVLFGFGTHWLGPRPHPTWVHAPGETGPLDNSGARLAALAWRLGLRLGVDYHVYGYLPDQQVLGMVRNATALAMPSFAEGGGSYPVEEALTLGVPVMCSDIPVMREHLAERSARVAWFDPYSPEAIRRAYREVMNEYNDFKASAVRGMADARPTWDDIAAAYVDVFRTVTEPRGSQ